MSAILYAAILSLLYALKAGGAAACVRATGRSNFGIGLAPMLVSYIAALSAVHWGLYPIFAAILAFGILLVISGILGYAIPRLDTE